MKRKKITLHARGDLDAISTFIARNNYTAAERFYHVTVHHFENLPDILTPERASPLLPEEVRKLQVKGFSGYTLHIAIFEDAIYLLSAFRPGLSDIQKIAHTKQSLKHRDR